ncbi:MAG: N-6 DNA methylase [Saprospiraceae bacterium]|nr:N-6 DNA methylase [Saprospiraceae bacterium]
MNKDTLIQLFKAPYKRQAFIDNALLPTFQGKVANLKIFDSQGVQEIELTASEQNYAVSVVKYGEFQTLDELPRTVELFEVIVNDNKQIERSRVGLGALVKKHIIGNNAVLVNFAYQNPEKRSWRFSFIARDGVFQDGEIQITDTHPKRYTYVFGEPDETYKTALDRFFVLGNELEITINKIKDAFGVEAMSKAFFDEYRDVHYAGFVDYLMRSNFKKSAFNGNDKDVRDFVKKLLGRIVFLYFLQKKGWLGAKDTSYKNGDKNFMTNFFNKAGANDAFYANWLSKLFFDALNNDRPNDDFTMPDGEVVKIPYLNGGLFEKESAKYDFLTFPADLFTNLFAFFDQYNFTIFEDSPEEHTVAVDPEMLGHIFENLLEDNKDKGAFYTPKEIVHYMTQESLIEYLHTQIPDAERNDLENFVKNKENKLSKEHKQQIDQKLDTVKICDPAIGSGAFPMGLLQEIFGLKERIAYDLGLPWSGELAAKTKENIIQKSIYGVDIERGAVDIARLRFWLSLIVDEEMPKALPNLDYKIVVGNSLVSKFDDTVIEIDWEKKTFGSLNENAKSITQKEENKLQQLRDISKKQKAFFESKNNAEKSRLKAEIRALKLEILIHQVTHNKIAFETNTPIKGGFMPSTKEIKQNLERELQIAEFNQALTKLKNLKDNPDQDFNHFDWKLDFPEVQNPLVNEKTGFDIVIANPPYLGDKGNKDKFRPILNTRLGRSFYKGQMDLFYFFFHLSFDLLNEKGNTVFITTNYFITADGAIKLREDFFARTNPISFINFNELRIFETALGQHNLITHLSKDLQKNRLINISISKSKQKFDLKYVKRFLDKDLEESEYFEMPKEKLFDGEKKYIRFYNTSNNGIELIFDKIKKDTIPLGHMFNINAGIGVTVSKITSKYLKDFPNEEFRLGDGVFVISKEEAQGLEKEIIKPFVKNSDITKYVYKKNQDFLIYLTRYDDINIYPETKKYLLKFKTILDDQILKYEELFPWYALNRPRSKELFEDNDKIILPYRSKVNAFAYSNEPIYGSRDVLYITKKNLNYEIKSLVAVLNSKLMYFWLFNKGKRKGDILEMVQAPVSEIPLKINLSKEVFRNLIDYLLHLSKINLKLNEFIPNSHISEAFEEVIDALVFELYFPDEFAEKGIEIEKYAQDIFKPIEDLGEEEQMKAIKEAYETLREKDNPLRNQIKLMKIELKELLLPILSV